MRRMIVLFRPLAILSAILILNRAHADDCDRARLEAGSQCKQLAASAIASSDQKLRSAIQNAGKNRALLQKAKKDYGSTSAQNLRHAAKQCRDTIPTCSKACDGDTKYCAGEIEKLAVDIERAAQLAIDRSSR